MYKIYISGKDYTIILKGGKNMAKIIVSQLVKTSSGIIAEDENGKKIGAKSLLQAGDIEIGENTYKINIVKSPSGISSTFNTTDKSSSLDIKNKNIDNDFSAAFKISKVSKKKAKTKLKNNVSKYNLVLIHRKKNTKGIIKDYKYDLVENATGNNISVLRTDIETFFLNPNWDNIDKSKKLLSGKDALVSGLTEQYYAKDNTWHLRVGKEIPFVIDEDIETFADSYIMTDVWARTVLTTNGKHKLSKYGYTLQNERTQESDYYTRDQLFSIFEIKEAPMDSRYDVLRLKNATLQYYKSKSGSESWRVRPNEAKVIWHIDESINTNTKDKYACLKVYRVQIPSKNGQVQNQYVEFEMAKLEDGELKDNTETFLVTGLDLVSLVEIPNAVEYPFYDSSRIDNLKIKNKKGNTVYEREAEIEVYKSGKLPSTCESNIEPVIIDLDYNIWSKSHIEHANKIEKFIKAREDRAVNKVITWDEVVAQPLSDEEMNIVGATFDDFWSNRFNCSCRLSTLSLTDESDTAFYDVTPMETERKIPNTFIVKESRNDGSLKSVSVLKFLLDGDEPQDIQDALGHHWVRFLSCICNALDRRLVLVIGVINNNRYAISCVDEMIQRKVLGGNSIYYLPFSWQEEVKVTVKAETADDAESLAKLKLNYMKNLPEKRTVVQTSIKIDESLAFELRSTKKATVRPDDIDMSMEDDTKGTVSFTDNNEVVYTMPEIKKENIYLVTAILDFFGYMAVKAETEEEAFTTELKKILSNKIPFSGKGQLSPYSALIISCDLISGKEPGVFDKDWFGDALADFIEENGDKTISQELVVLSEETNSNWLIMRLIDGTVYAIDIEMSVDKYPIVLDIQNDKIISLISDGLVIKTLTNSNDVNSLYDTSLIKDKVDNINSILGFEEIQPIEQNDNEAEFWDSLGGEEIVLDGLVSSDEEDKEVVQEEPIDISTIEPFSLNTNGITTIDIPLDMNKTIEFNNQKGLVKDLLDKLFLSNLKVVYNSENFDIDLMKIGHIEYYSKLKSILYMDNMKSKYSLLSKYTGFSINSTPMNFELQYLDDDDNFKLFYKIGAKTFESVLTLNHFDSLDSDVTKKIIYVDNLVSQLFTPSNVESEYTELELFFVKKEEEDNEKYLKEYWESVRPGEEFDAKLANKLITEEARKASLEKQKAKENDVTNSTDIDTEQTLTKTVSSVHFKLNDADVKIEGTRPKLTVRELFDRYLPDGYDDVCKLFNINYSLVKSFIDTDKKRVLKQILYPYNISFTSLGFVISTDINLENKALSRGLSLTYSNLGFDNAILSIGTSGANILTRNQLVLFVKEFVDKIYDILVNFDGYETDYTLDNQGNYIIPSITKNMFLKCPAKFEVNEYEMIEPINSTVSLLDKMYVDAYANFVLKNTNKNDFSGLILRQNRWKRKDVLTLLEKQNIIESSIDEPDMVLNNDDGFSIIRYLLLTSKDNKSIKAKFITQITKKPAKLKCYIEIDDMRWLTSVDKFVGSWVDYDTTIGNILLGLVNEDAKEQTLEIDWDGAKELDLDTNKETEISLDFGEASSESDSDLDDLFDSLDTINVSTPLSTQVLSDAESDDLFDSSPIMTINTDTNIFNTDNESTGLEDLDDLTSESVVVDVDMFKSVFNSLLEVIDDSYVLNSFEVTDNVITFIDTKKYYSTQESIDRIVALLIKINPVKISAGYLRMLKTLRTKSVYDTILDYTIVIATLNKYKNSLGRDFVNTHFKEDYLINAIASTDVLTQSLSDTGINAGNFKFLNGVTRK